MSPFTIVAQREFLSRVRKRTFLLMTLLGPLFFGGLIVGPALLSEYTESPDQRLLVVDNSFLLVGTDRVGKAQLDYLNPEEFSEDQALEALKNRDEFDGLLFLPTSENADPDFILRNARLYNKNDVSLDIVGDLENTLASAATEEKLKMRGVDPAVVTQAQTQVNIRTMDLTDEGAEESAVGLKMAIGFGAGFFVYIFTFLYAAQIMRGVIEEKTSRIVEVIVSSVKPTQLMLGKILGIAAVGLLQFLIWVVLTGTILFAVSATGLLSPDAAELAANPGMASSPIPAEITGTFKALNLPLLVSSFLVYFLGGYLLYGALFAAVGAAVDSETDTQQFMLPLTMPLVLTFVLATSIIENPNGPLAFWLSVIPFSSPIAMMIRLPFGVPGVQLALSMGLLVLGFLFTTWLAGRIYRIGILSYGKKVTYGDLWKWIRMKP
jgi:ABC-2 type transport system permease protein